MTTLSQDLKRFVISDGRVWPNRWHEFSKLISATYPDVPPPLILGGAHASDMAKRVRLLTQIHYVREDVEVLSEADRFLRSIPLDGWHRAEDPLSNIDSWGNEDVPTHYYTLILE